MKTFASKEKRSAPAVRKTRPYVHHPMGPVQQAQRAEIHRILHSTGAQAKLTIGPSNDRYEQEADRVADRVLAMPDPKLQRQPEVEEEEEVIRTKSLADQISPLVQRQEEPPEEEEEEPIQAKLIQRQPENEKEEEIIQTKSLADQITPLVQRQEELPEEEEEPVQAKSKDDEMIQRTCRECAEETAQRQAMEEEEEEIQTKTKPGRTPTVTPSLESRINSCKGSGQPFNPIMRNFFERRIGRDFSKVRVHHGGQAAEIARSVSARALTLGNSVMFGSGEYAPDTATGQRLIAHELTHVVQQNSRTRGPQGMCSIEGEANNLPGIRQQSISAQPLIQRDLAIRPPRPRAVGRNLTAARVTEAINYNKRYLSNIPNSVAVIRMIRDVLGINPTPSVVDADFVSAVLDWQAMYRLTQDGKLGPSSARRLFREIGAEKEGRGKVKSGPRYSPQVPTVTAAGGRKSASFRFNSEFESDPAKGLLPPCCEVRQFIRWDAAAAASFAAIRGAGNTVPHAGFPAAHPANRWIEDRNATNTIRYGHRSRFSPGIVGNRYLDLSGRRNQAYGHIYRGRDNPAGPAALAGQWQFLVKVIDVCNGGRNIGRMDVIRINW